MSEWIVLIDVIKVCVVVDGSRDFGRTEYANMYFFLDKLKKELNKMHEAYGTKLEVILLLNKVFTLLVSSTITI